MKKPFHFFYLFAFCLFILWGSFMNPREWEAQSPVKKSEILGITPRIGNIPEYRKCGDFSGQTEKSTPILSEKSSYSKQRLEKMILQQEKKMKKVLHDIANNHRSLVKAYPQFKQYYEVEVEDMPENKEEGLSGTRYENLKITIAFHYRSPGELDCVVIDAYQSRIYEADHYTHKLFRFPYSDIRKVSLEYKGYNYERKVLLSSYALDDQLLVLRTIFFNLLKALHKVDMIVASYKYYQTKLNRWQGNI